MTVRPAVADFLAQGPLPDEDQPAEAIEHAGDLLDRIERPVTDEEAAALATRFGPDNCYGLAWSLLHLIETAPGLTADQYPADSENIWVRELRLRAENAQAPARQANPRGQHDR